MTNKGKPTKNWAAVSRLLAYVWRGYRLSLVLALVLIFISSLATVNMTASLRILIDGYILPLTQSEVKDFAPLARFLGRLGLIGLAGVVANYSSSLILVRVSQGTLRSLRDALFAHMQKLPVKYFDTHQHGDIMSVYTNDIDTLRQVIEQSIPQLLTAVVTIVGVSVSMLRVSPLLFGVVLIMLMIMVTVITLLSKRSKRYFGQQQQHLGLENGYIEEMMSGQKVVKAFVYEDEAVAHFTELNEQLFQSAYKANAFANVLMPTLGNLGNLSYVLTAIVGGSFAIQGLGGLTIGGLVAFLQLNRSFAQPIAQVSQQLNFVLMALAGGERIFGLLDEAVEVNEGQVTLVNYELVDGQMVVTDKPTNLWAWKHPRPNGQFELVELVGNVQFHDVDFAYNEEQQILHEINLHAAPGQKIAFVGATGAGKTTITNLINRFYDIQSGSITYDGIDVKLIDKASLRKSLGIVLQDTHLFTGTISENIAYGRQNATPEEILAAAKIANVDTFVNHLEQGYDTVLTGDGAGLSNGQRQLIAIARAALANAPVLILDEATSSIDSRTERMVQDGMDKLMAGRTVFVIAHRLSTIVNSDVIMVMDKGRIIERGNHASLMAKQGVYHRLYTGGLELD